MKHCTNCGQALTEELQFCPNCGQKTEQPIAELEVPTEATPPVVENPTDDVAAQQLATKSPQKKKKKRWIALIAVIVILAIAHFTIKQVTDPAKTIVAMNEAFQKEDAKTFLSEFKVGKDVHSDAKTFFKYVDTQDWSDIRQSLQTNLASLENTGIADSVETSDGTELIRLEKKDILGGLYYTVDYKLVPIKVSVENDDYNNIEFTSEETTVNMKKDEETFVGDFLPGSYKWSATLKSEFGALPFDGTMEVASEDNEFTYEPDIEPHFVTIYSNNSDAIIYVNGKSTERSVYDTDEIGPLPLDGSVKVQAVATEAGKTYKTKEVKVQRTEVQLDFDYITAREAEAEREEMLSDLVYENSEDITSFYEDYRQAYESDLNNHTFDATKYYLSEGSKAQNELKAFFPQYVDGDSISNHSNYVDSLTAIDESTFVLKTNEDYTFYSHEGPIYDYEYNRTYTIVKTGSDYVITNIDKQKVSEEVTNVDDDEDDYDDEY